MSNRRDRGLWRRRAQRGGGEQLTAEGQHPNHSSSSSGFRTADSDRMVQPAEGDTSGRRQRTEQPAYRTSW
ncbi:unnamed protein product [Arctogadus glacialis]